MTRIDLVRVLGITRNVALLCIYSHRLSGPWDAGSWCSASFRWPPLSASCSFLFGWWSKCFCFVWILESPGIDSTEFLADSIHLHFCHLITIACVRCSWQLMLTQCSRWRRELAAHRRNTIWKFGIFLPKLFRTLNQDCECIPWE